MIQGNVVNLLPGMSLGQVMNPWVDNNFINYVQSNFQENFQRLQEFGSTAINTMQQLFQHFTSNEYINRAREIAIDTGARNDSSIYPVDCNTIYDSGFVMAGYIMADPVIWDMYSKFRVNGFDDMFRQQDMGESNPYRKTEYMQVMDGIVQYQDDGYQLSWYSHSGDDLTLREKLTVLDAWDCAEFLIEQGIDPTSPSKEEL